MGRRDPDLVMARVLGHDTRLHILALFTRDRARSLAVDDLLRDLRATAPDTYADTRPKQIHYHLTCLQDAELLPRAWAR